MRESLIYVVHPDTGKMYDLNEAAEIVGTKHNTIYGRIRRGDKGRQIWRPVGVRAKDVDPGETSFVMGHTQFSDEEEIFM